MFTFNNIPVNKEFTFNQELEKLFVFWLQTTVLFYISELLGLKLLKFVSQTRTS